MVQELSGEKRDKYPLNNVDTANCKDIKIKESLDNVFSDKPEDVEVSGQETLSSDAAINTSVRPRQDLDTKDISEMDSRKGNEESKKISFTTGGSESNGNMAAKIFGAKRQAQVPHNKILTAVTIKSLQTQPLLRNEHSAWIMKRIDQIQIKPRA